MAVKMTTVRGGVGLDGDQEEPRGPHQDGGRCNPKGRQGQGMSTDVAGRLMELEAKLEQTVRTQPLIAIGLASVVGFALSEVTHRR